MTHLRALAVTSLVLVAAVLLAQAQDAPSPALSATQRADLERWWESQPRIDLPFDNNGAKVLLVEFTDLQCPHCRAKYIELKPILEKYAARPKELTFLLKHWPISSACNSRVQTDLHPVACDLAAAVVMARPKGTQDALLDWLFMHQDGMTPAIARQAAADVGKVADFDAQLARAMQEVKTDIALGSALGVDATPSFFLNGRRIPGGGVAPQYFEALIGLELARAKP
jgi:protein-disulfide isomerase